LLEAARDERENRHLVFLIQEPAALSFDRPALMAPQTPARSEMFLRHRRDSRL
jgi:hypothetical protein